MSDPVTTASSLLEGSHDPGRHAWRTRDARFRPAITGLVQRSGLNGADADDAAQETLAQFFHAYIARKSDWRRARFPTWLVGVAWLRITDVKRGRAGRRGPARLRGPSRSHGSSQTTERRWP